MCPAGADAGGAGCGDADGDESDHGGHDDQDVRDDATDDNAGC